MVPPQMMGAELRTYCRAKNSTSLSAGSFSGAHMLQDRPANVPGQTRLWTRGLPSFVAKLREFGREVTCAAARSKHACRRQTRGRELLGGAPPPRPVATDLAYARQVDSGRLGRTSTQSSRQNRGQSVRTCDGRSVIGQGSLIDMRIETLRKHPLFPTPGHVRRQRVADLVNRPCSFTSIALTGRRVLD